MSDYITIDGGTTNTRISLLSDNKIIHTKKISAGAKSGIDNRNILKEKIRDTIDEIRGKQNTLTTAILACGMITSEFGLYPVAHIPAPAGIAELHNNIATVSLPDISNIPFSFIPGVKLCGKNLCDTDMMRGEETELMGLSEKIESDCLYVLPGSHSKIITTDSNGGINKFTTMLTGEMIWALAKDTILKDSVNLSQNDTDGNFLAEGYEYCEKYGLNAALFKVRILKNIFDKSDKQLYSFFIGAVLYAEIRQISDADESKVIIGGRAQIKNAMYKLLKIYSHKEIICIPDNDADAATIRGMIKIYEYKR